MSVQSKISEELKEKVEGNQGEGTLATGETNNQAVMGHDEAAKT